jgi:hypothetical protein
MIVDRLDGYVINWVNDETAEITLDGYEVVTIDHSEHGWAGMDAVLETVKRIAELTGHDVRVTGTPNL